MWIPLPAMVTLEVQVHLPAGMITVSPPEEELIALCTSDELQVVAVMVFACASVPTRVPRRTRNKIDFISVAICVRPQNND
jgi:hypothetical protein